MEELAKSGGIRPNEDRDNDMRSSLKSLLTNSNYCLQYEYKLATQQRRQERKLLRQREKQQERSKQAIADRERLAAVRLEREAAAEIRLAKNKANAERRLAAKEAAAKFKKRPIEKVKM